MLRIGSLKGLSAPYFGFNGLLYRRIHQQVDVLIVGGGIVGAATALTLKNKFPSLTAVLVEKENKLAAHQSGHNSGVVHAGIYYPPGSLKAQLCVRGMKLAYDYFDKHSIPYKKVGKLIVAVNSEEAERLHDLYERGQLNGVADLELINSLQIKQIQPGCQGDAAIWSPHTGIVDWAEVTRHYCRQFELLGGGIQLDSEVTAIKERTCGDTDNIKHRPISVTFVDKDPIRCSHVICCAGLHSDRLAALSGCPAEPRIVPFRGEYLLLRSRKQHLITTNIYPVPQPGVPFLGVHFTPRLDGSVWLGPNAVWATAREAYSWSNVSLRDVMECVRYRGFRRVAGRHLTYGVTEMMRSLFVSLQVRQLQRYMPDISRADVVRGPAGVRAQALDSDGQLVDEFIIQTAAGPGEIAARVMHVRNAPSPAATSSLAIAEDIVKRAATDFHLHSSS